MKSFVVLFLILSLTSCSFQSRDNQVQKKSKSGIVGGELVDHRDALASSIVAIMNMEDGAICTGTLIASNIVVTAAHCVLDAKAYEIKIIFGVNVDQVLSTLEPDIQREYIRTVKSYTIHPKYNPKLHEENKWDWHDIAIIKFKGEYPEEYQPIQILPETSILNIGDRVQMAGYGVTEVKAEEIDPSTAENIEEAIEYGKIICEDDEKLMGCVKIESSGEGELYQTEASILDIMNTEVVLDESEGHSTCSGDSGGPIFIELGGVRYLFGITSRGGLLCDDVGVYTNATVYLDWIQQTIQTLNRN